MKLEKILYSFDLYKILKGLEDNSIRLTELLGDEVIHLILATSLSYIAYWALVHYGDIGGHNHACPICKSPLLRRFVQKESKPHHLEYICINQHCPKEVVFSEEYSSDKDISWIYGSPSK